MIMMVDAADYFRPWGRGDMAMRRLKAQGVTMEAIWAHLERAMPDGWIEPEDINNYLRDHEAEIMADCGILE